MYFSEFEADGVTIKEWGWCIKDCPSEFAETACLEEPQFPAYASYGDGFVNYTTDYVQGSQEVLLEVGLYFQLECE